jgi:Protein of unknown function (DUF3485)
MMRAIPIVLAVVAIAVLTVVEGVVSDRWTNVNREATYAAYLLDEVPSEFGDWKGVDQLVDEETQRVAGAEGYVSRTYTNEATGQQVSVWLIVGHARDTAEHTPDVCYPASGLNPREENAPFTMTFEGQPSMRFWTAMFVSNRAAAGPVCQRVFWTWFRPTDGESKGWEAPRGNARWYYGSARALYKMYFTTATKDPDEAPEASPAAEFAKEFMPIVNEVLAKANLGAPDDFDAAAAREAMAKNQAETQRKLAEVLKNGDGG